MNPHEFLEHLSASLFPALGAGLLAAGTQFAGGLLNAFSTGKQNKKQRQFIRERYGVERADALSDWAMQNEYNSPKAQMQRLQEANLNPHLVYGGGSGVTQAGQIKSTDSKSYSPSVPRIGDAMPDPLSIYDMEIKKAQVDNLTANNTNILMDALLKKADLAAKDLNNKQRVEMDEYARKFFDANPQLYSFLQKDRQVSASYRFTEQQESELMQRIRHNEQKHPGNLQLQFNAIQESLQRQATSVAQRKEIAQRITQMVKDGRLKDLHIQMRENGIEPTDPQWQRILIRAINGEGILGKLK